MVVFLDSSGWFAAAVGRRGNDGSEPLDVEEVVVGREAAAADGGRRRTDVEEEESIDSTVAEEVATRGSFLGESL